MNALYSRKRVGRLRAVCLEGSCWITWQGSGDVVLEPGQSVEVRGRKRFCLEILGQGRALIEEGGRGRVRTLEIGTPAACAAT